MSWHQILEGIAIKSRIEGKIAVALGMGVSFAILCFLISGHFEALKNLAGSLNWSYFLAAILCSVASYSMMGLALWEILRLLGSPCPFFPVLGISFVSSTANYLISSGGISGFALKAHLLRKRQVPYGTTLTSSVLSTTVIYFVLAVIIAQGLGYLFINLRGERLVVLEGIFGLVVLALTSVPLFMFFFVRKLRNRLALFVFHRVNRLVYIFSKREIPREDFDEFESQLNHGLGVIRKKKGRLTLVIGYTCLEWFFAIWVLYFGFQAVGLSLPIGYLTTSFAVGQAAALIPFLPGGLGAVEGAMAGLLQKLGIVLAKALMGVFLYRAAYYILPGVCSIFLLWGLKVSEPGFWEDKR